jgi:hypothetical protein
MKNLFYTLFILMLISSCAPTIRMSVEKKQSFKLNDDLFIVTHDNVIARDFIIYVKNYLALNLESYKIKVIKHNLFEGEKYDIPNVKYIMDVKFDDIETEFKNQHIKKCFIIINIIDSKTNETVWTSQLIVKAVSEVDRISRAKRISKKVIDELIKNYVLQ